MSIKKTLILIMGLLVSSCSDDGSNISVCVDDQPCGNDAGVVSRNDSGRRTDSGRVVDSDRPIRYRQYYTNSNEWSYVYLWDERGREYNREGNINTCPTSITRYRIRTIIEIGYMGDTPTVSNIVSVQLNITEVAISSLPPPILTSGSTEFSTTRSSLPLIVVHSVNEELSYICRCQDPIQRHCDFLGRDRACNTCPVDLTNRIHFSPTRPEEMVIVFKLFNTSNVYGRLFFTSDSPPRVADVNRQS